MKSHYFQNIYVNLASALLEAPRSAPRGMPTRELINVNYTLLDPTQELLNWQELRVPEREATYLRYLKQEHEWYLSGSLRASTAPAKFWLQLADADGNIVSNYGAMILHERKYANGMTAFEHVIHTLWQDPSSRRAIMHYSEPRHAQADSLDVPCTLSSQFLLRDGFLHLIVTQRSSDFKLGLVYDVPWHCYLLRTAAYKLTAGMGHLHHNIGSLHVYEKDLPLVERIARGTATAV